MLKTMKNTLHKLNSLNDVQWALIGIAGVIITIVILACLGIYKVDVLH